MGEELGGKDTAWEVLFKTTLFPFYSGPFEFNCHSPKELTTSRQVCRGSTALQRLEEKELPCLIITERKSSVTFCLKE